MTIDKKSKFEELIDKMILEKTPGFDDTTIEEFKNLSVDEKITSSLSILDKNRDMFTKIKRSVNDISKTEHTNNLLELMRAYVSIGDVDTKQFGEIMTPQGLVIDMVDKLPVRVWSNPNLKWLDNCAGVGIFQAVIINRLMDGLSEWEPNEEVRYAHIVENMIYMGELQSKNLFLAAAAIDPKDEYNLNIYAGDFLGPSFDIHSKDVWGIESFDVIVGNPPFNIGTKGGNGSRDLWDKFVFKSISILSDGGFLNYVHPSKWRGPEHKLLKAFKKHNLTYLEIHSDIEGKKVFGATTRYDFYVLEKSNYGGSTFIKDEEGVEHNIDIMKWDWIPNYNFELMRSVIKGDDEPTKVVYSRTIYGNDKKWMSKERTKENTLPCVYGMYKDGTCSYRYSNVDKGHFGAPKVILGLGRHLYPKIDLNGNYGTMNNAFYIEIDSLEEGENIKRAIESEKFKEIVKATKWSNFQVNYKMFKSFRKDFWKEFV